MKRNTAKRTLLMSIISMLLCVSMLVGTTFAWFTDSVTSSNNIIASGNLDIELQYWNGEKWIDVQSASDILTNSLWEPGVTEIAYLRIANAGSLALKYQLGIKINREDGGINKAGDPFLLSKYIEFGVTQIEANAQTKAPVTYATREDAVDAVTGAMKLNDGYTKSHTLYPVNNLPENVEDAASELYLALVVYMPTSVGNEANHNGTNIPEIELGISVVATQLTYENDSFDNQYDVASPYPVLTPLVDVPDDGPMTIGDDTMETTLPEELVNKLPDAAEKLRLRYAEPKVGTVSREIVFDFADVVDQDGNVVDLEAMGNDVYITVKLDVSDNFTEGDTLNIFHDSEFIAPVTVDKDGYITYNVLHFCEIKAVDCYMNASDKDGEIHWTELPKEADKKYPSSYESLIDGKSKNNDYVLVDNVVVSDKIYFGDNTKNSINLNGQKVTTESSYVFATQGENCELEINGIGTVVTDTGYAAFANKNSTLTINGGTYQLGPITQASHFYVQNSATMIINDGTYISTDPDTPILYCINGLIEINGGFFQNTANPKTALLSMGNNLKYADNQKITLKGGTFVNWNPMSSAFARPWTNPDVPALIVLADGYQMISETQENGDVWYMVVPVTSDN